jgi:hypothetical protein
MDGAKPSSISASELYPVLAPPRRRGLLMRAATGNANQGVLRRPSSWPPDPIALWNRDRQLEPAGLSRTRSRRAGGA